MGYTHYFEKTKRDFTYTEFKKLCKFTTLAIKMIENDGVVIKNGFGEDKPIITEEGIYLNGDASKGLDHEGFFLEPTVKDSDFCKTAMKPYDTLVTAILLFCKKKFPRVLTLNSDGDINGDDWSEGRKLFVKVKNQMETTH